MSRYCLETPRLGFRPLTHEDEEDVVALNQDPKVMHFFPDVMSIVQSQTYIEKSMAHFNTYGYSNYAVELKETNTFIGVMGLLKIGFEHELKGQVEIGWRLKKDYWHQGYVVEGARALLDYASQLGIKEVYSFTAAINFPSEQVMKRISMTYVVQFLHPNVEETSVLRPHVLYVKRL